MKDKIDKYKGFSIFVNVALIFHKKDINQKNGSMAKKQNLSYQEIESSLEKFKKSNILPNDVGYEILRAFGKSDADIRRYREGKGILTSFDGLMIKGLFGYKMAVTSQISTTLENMKHDIQVTKAAPKIIAVSDGKTLIAYDLREKETYENPLSRLYCDFAFFYPLCGVEKFENISESPADVKAAEKLAKLHDELRAYNEFSSKSELHDLNIFIARLLFCFFAEDTGIFEENLFTGSVVRYTKEDGSDLADYLGAAFNVMDIRVRNEATMKIISQFPYVNGGLFRKTIQIPNMSFKARKLIIECGELDWKDINPDIFGSMIQAVVDPNVRANQGMHYTSVPNIMKVINPLFLDELRNEFNSLNEEFQHIKQMHDIGGITSKELASKGQAIVKKCNTLLERIGKMKFFDPACGSGNFLIITYKSLRLLEMDILKLQQHCCEGQAAINALFGSHININQFYGIELLDFPHEVAMLSMWLAQHQMDRKLFELFGVNTQALPLHNITQIVCDNSCRLDWNIVCTHTKEDEVFVFGNPPYLGGKLQSESQKSDLKLNLCHFSSYKNLDYISIWFYKAASFIKSKEQCSFVSTNSIVQGEQVDMLWPYIFDMNVEISFAYQSFKWSNNAKYNAGVSCVIIGLARTGVTKVKHLYYSDKDHIVNNINPYLNSGSNLTIKSAREPISNFPIMGYGNMPLEGNFLKLSLEEKNELIHNYPESKELIRPLIGGEELINGIPRFCLWIDNDKKDKALSIEPIRHRIEQVYKFRQNGGDVARTLLNRPHQFRYRKVALKEQILLAQTSSERRDYLQCDYCSNEFITMHSVNVIFDADMLIFGILSSKLHMIWTKTIGGYLGTSIRYSNSLCYNTFPFPRINIDKKKEITEAAENILITRAGHPEQTLAEMYDPDKMPQDLLDAHKQLDETIESCYIGYPFVNDEARLECLFKLYEKMTKK